MTNHDQSYISKNWEPGDIKYKDLNGDDKIDKGKNTVDDHGDLKIIGNTTSRYNYGITANLGYKGFFLNIFMQGVGKRDSWPSNQAFWPAPTQYFAVQNWFIEDSWSEDNRNAYFYRPLARDTKNRQAQTRYLQDASYLRMKNLTFGYDFPKAISNKLCMSKLQVYISGENLFEIQHMKGPFDPESAEANGNVVYPFQRSFSIGLNVTF
ncbi:MAG: hypothetical protein LUH15_10015 [Tannerellaceae bacterium]|nr:hypothetical protein [Tannerellaceae bacterium]